MLEAKDVNFAYLRGQPVINDMECRIEDGEFVALLGHNGSGKTTLSRLFMALCHPRSGQILVDGEDIVKCEPADLADKIGYVFQNPDLQILEDTVFDEVAYGPRAKKLTEETIKRQTTEALEAAGGLLPEARAERVNLAKKLRDGSQVYVPFAKNSAAQGSGGAGSAAKNRTKAGAYDKLDAGDSSGKLNLNTASQEQLIALPGIGPSMANRILALRRTRRFHKVEDLLQVRGIGQAKLERLRRYVTVE